MKPLVVFAHPAVRHSRTNWRMFKSAGGLPGVGVLDLYAEYPKFDIDVEREQQRLLEYDVIVLQFPLFWYSTPPIVKEWMDLVLEHDFAYGEHGRMLEGKRWLCAVTAGAPEHSYGVGGRHLYSLRQFLAPLEATAGLCRMSFISPYVLFGSLGVDEGARHAHVDGYVRLLEALRDDRFDFAAAAAMDLISAPRLKDALLPG